MKRFNSIKKIVASGALLLTLGLTSCEDFLTIYPTGQITEEDFWQDKTDLTSGIASCYYQLSSADVVGKIIRWGECRSDNLLVRNVSNTSLTNLKDAILLPTDANFEWGPFYTGINYCNTVIEHGQDVVDRDPSYTAEEWKYDKAEMISLRALYYFYLIRAFGDVPAVFEAVTTDAKVKFDKQTAGLTLLSTLISQVDSVKDMTRTNFGSSVMNKGRLTRNAVYTLLADLYLWRGSMLRETTISDVTKDTVNAEQSKADFQSAIDLCTIVLNDLNSDFEHTDRTSFGSNFHSPSGWLVDKYPIYSYSNITDGATDFIDYLIFSQGNSSESLFELQYDGSNRYNSSAASYYYTVSSTNTVGTMIAGLSYASSIDPTKGYGLTDFRYRYNVYLHDANQTEYPVVKFATSGVSIGDIDNVGAISGSYTFRNSSTSQAGWIIYRVSDVMFIKAEAISRIAETNSDDMWDGFYMVNALFARSNPAADSTGSSQSNDAVKTSRLCTTYPRSKTGTQLYDLVYREKQRDLFGEGKRWFDLVRMAEADGTTANALDYMGASRAVKIRLRLLKSFYNPVYSGQIKINQELVQNPVWDTGEE